jgi:hypothetical protein
MAYNPIVLKSNIVPSSGLGALPNMYRPETGVRRDSTIENEDGTFTIPTYQRTEIDIPDDFDWSMYGTKYAPMLRYFNKVRTGEIIYNPEDDRINEDLLGEMIADRDSNLPTEAEMIKQELIGVGTQLAAGIGGQIGRAYAATGEMGSALDAYTGQDEFKDFLFPSGDGATAKVPFSSDSGRFALKNLNEDINKGNFKTALASDNPLESAAYETEMANLEGQRTSANTNVVDKAQSDLKTSLQGVTGNKATNYMSGVKDRGSSFGENATAAGRANLYGSAGAGAATIAANLIAGKNLKESVKSGAKVGVGTYVGTLIGGPLGGMIGGILGGRVICNELMRQGIMTRKQVVLDYKFTEDYLTPQHVAGYHVWAVWMVKQMRKGRLVNFWTHVAGHRANEIAYIYGERDKPDYLGKVYRKVLEPICWSIGFFCQKTDWTVLYKEKEI